MMQQSEPESKRSGPAAAEKRWRAFKRALACVLVLVAVLILSLSWSARGRHTLRRVGVKARMQLASWGGDGPRLVSLSGRTNVPAIEIQALDSRSGWATLAGIDGSFVLPDVIWYPGASYDLVFSSAGERDRLARISPSGRPDGGTLDVGELNVAGGQEVERARLEGVNDASYVAFDEANRSYYRDVFDKLTAGEQTDQGKILAVNAYVSTKLNYEQSERDGTAREVLDRGSKYCGQLAGAFATLLASAGYRTRAIDMTDHAPAPNSHMVAEAYYEGAWHLFDPTYGVTFQNRAAGIVSYHDIRMDPGLFSEEHYGKLEEEARRRLLAWLPRAYATGYHHYYRFRE